MPEMQSTNLSFGETTASLYDKLLAPLMFTPCAEVVSERIKSLEPAHILELAAGTGVLTRAVVSKLPQTVKITATDISEPMIHVARSRMNDDENVTWQRVDATSLPFADGAFDLVICQFGIMFFPDKISALRQAKRVLKVECRCLYIVWDDWMTMAEAPLQIAAHTIAKLLECEPNMLVNPGYFDKDLIRRDFVAAEFEDIKIESIVLPSEAASAYDGVMTIVYGSLIRNAIEEQDVISLDEARVAVEEALVDKFGHGRIEGRTRALIITASN